MDTKKLKYLYSAIIVICTFMIFRSQVFFERTWLFMGLGMLLTFFNSGKYYKSSIFAWALLYLSIVLFDHFSGDLMFRNFSSSVFNEAMMLILPTAITYPLIRRNDRKTMKCILILFFCFFLLTTLSSFIISLSLPGAIRKITLEGYLGEDTSSYNSLYMMGLSNYYLPHAAPALIPAAYLGATNKSLRKTSRWLLWAVLVCLILLTYLSGSTTALLFSIFSLIAVFVIKKGTFAQNLLRISFVTIFALPIIGNQHIQYELTDMLVSVTEGTDFQGKALELRSAIVYEDVSGGDVEERMDLYSESWRGFLQNILIGTNEKTGGHSSALDRLGHLGLIGFIPLMLFFVAQMKEVKRQMMPNMYIYYFLGMLQAILMIFVKNMFFWETAIIAFAILPMTIFVYGNNNKIIYGNEV